MKNKIEKAIRETLVIQNKQSVHIAVDKIYSLCENNDGNQSSIRDILIAASKGIYPQGDERKQIKLIDKYLDGLK